MKSFTSIFCMVAITTLITGAHGVEFNYPGQFQTDQLMLDRCGHLLDKDNRPPQYAKAPIATKCVFYDDKQCTTYSANPDLYLDPQQRAIIQLNSPLPKSVKCEAMVD